MRILRWLGADKRQQASDESPPETTTGYSPGESSEGCFRGVYRPRVVDARCRTRCHSSCQGTRGRMKKKRWFRINKSKVVMGDVLIAQKLAHLLREYP